MSIATQKASDVRKKFSEFVDSVVHKKPQFVNRNERDFFMSINVEHFRPILEDLTFEVEMEYDEEAKEYVCSINRFHVVASGETEDECLHQAALFLQELGQQYYDDFELYSKTPDHKHRFPYFMKSILFDTEELKASFHVQYE